LNAKDGDYISYKFGMCYSMLCCSVLSYSIQYIVYVTFCDSDTYFLAIKYTFKYDEV